MMYHPIGLSVELLTTVTESYCVPSVVPLVEPSTVCEAAPGATITAFVLESIFLTVILRNVGVLGSVTVRAAADELTR